MRTPIYEINYTFGEGEAGKGTYVAYTIEELNQYLYIVIADPTKTFAGVTKN